MQKSPQSSQVPELGTLNNLLKMKVVRINNKPTQKAPPQRYPLTEGQCCGYRMESAVLKARDPSYLALVTSVVCLRAY